MSVVETYRHNHKDILNNEFRITIQSYIRLNKIIVYKDLKKEFYNNRIKYEEGYYVIHESFTTKL